MKIKVVKTIEALTAVAFGLAYWKYDLRVATGVLMAMQTLLVLAAGLLRVTLTKLQIGTWFVVVILGSLSLISANDEFIKWKPTIVNSVIGLAFLLSHKFMRRTLLETFVEKKVPAPSEMLRKTNFAAGVFFIAVGALNLVVVKNFSDTVWVNFKIFGVLALNLCFVSGALYYLRGYIQVEQATDHVGGAPEPKPQIHDK